MATTDVANQLPVYGLTMSLSPEISFFLGVSNFIKIYISVHRRDISISGLADGQNIENLLPISIFTLPSSPASQFTSIYQLWPGTGRKLAAAW